VDVANAEDDGPFAGLRRPADGRVGEDLVLEKLGPKIGTKENRDWLLALQMWEQRIIGDLPSKETLIAAGDA
jgi:hypothetical protein